MGKMSHESKHNKISDLVCNFRMIYDTKRTLALYSKQKDIHTIIQKSIFIEVLEVNTKVLQVK